jgi:hypothetical protein
LKFICLFYVFCAIILLNGKISYQSAYGYDVERPSFIGKSKINKITKKKQPKKQTKKTNQKNKQKNKTKTIKQQKKQKINK